MKRRLRLFYAKRIPHSDLRMLEGMDLDEAQSFSRLQGYGLLYFPVNDIKENINSYKELKPYLTGPIRVNLNVIINEEGIKRDYKLPSYFKECIEQSIVENGIAFKFIGLPPEGRMEERVVTVPLQVLKEKYMKIEYDEIYAVYTYSIGSWGGNRVDTLLQGKGKIQNNLHYYQLSEEMYNHMTHFVDSDFCMCYINNLEEGFFYELKQK